MKKIKDLIEIPHIETVIKINELYDYDSANIEQKIYDTFVLTEEVLSGLTAVIKKISQKESSGFIVKGSYGSGKSHLLAYIAAIAGSSPLFNRLCAASAEIAHFQKDFFPGEILPVPVSLTSYQQDISLENAVFDSIRKTIVNTGLAFPESIAAKIIDDFKKYVAEALTAEFFKQYGDQPLDTQVAHLREFLSEKNIAFTPLMSRDDLYTVIEKSLQQHYPGGLLLLIDEVSEFLRSRTEIDINSEDIRFLQFMGEWNLGLNCWTVLSMQEDIEEISNMSEVALNKIRDRYNNRIYLSTTHIKELLEKRLSVKKEGSREAINDVYFEFRDYFPTWTLNFDDFYHIYPVHPATVYYLESISNLFSKSRGMVEFFYNSLHADMPDTQMKYIDQDANVLITPDRVFDNFLDKIQENLATHDFVDKIYKDYVKEIPLIFKEAEDTDADEVRDQIKVATQIVKILILTEIAPGLKKLTIGKLAELTGKGISQLEQDTNINYIRYLLNRLMDSLAYIKRDEVDGRNNDIYYISPEKTALNRFDDEVRKNSDRIAHIEKKAIQMLIQSCSHSRLPLQNFYQRELVEQCAWQETTRRLAVSMAMPDRLEDAQLDDWEQQLERGEIEYVLVQGYPVEGADKKDKLWEQLDTRSNRMQKSFVYWQPTAIPEKQLHSLTNYYAQQYTFRSIHEENPAFFGSYESEICQRLDHLRLQAQDILMESYFPPALYMYANVDVFEEVARIIVDYTQLKQKLTDRLLTSIYSEHHKIKPILTEPPLSSIHEVIRYINENIAGQHFLAPSQAMCSMLKNLVEKLHLLKFKEQDIYIDPRPQQSTFVRELLKVIEEQNPGYDSLYPYFRCSVFGCTEAQFVVALYLLEAAGYIQICQNHNPLPSKQLTVKAIQHSDMIMPGAQVSQRFVKEHEKLVPIVGKINANELHLKGQERVWEELLKFRETNEHRIANIRALLQRYQSTPPFSDATFADDIQALDYLSRLFAHLKRSYPSGKGIDLTLIAIESVAGLQDALLRMEQLLNLDNAKLQHVTFIHEYVGNPIISDVLKASALKDLHQSIVETTTALRQSLNGIHLERLFSDFEEFRTAYIRLYSEYHEALYPDAYYKSIRSVRQAPEYAVLRELSHIELVSVTNDFIRIDNMVNQMLNLQCQHDVQRELQYKPMCACHFKTESVEHQFTRDELLEMIRSGIAEYFAAIQSDENMDKIIQYKMASNQVHDHDMGDVFDFFLNMDVLNFPAGVELSRNINARTIATMNDALAGDIHIIEKRLDDLADALYGRKFKPERLRQMFDEWLAETDLPDGEVYIAVTDSRRATSGSRFATLPAILIDKLRKLWPDKGVEQAAELVILHHVNTLLSEFGIDISHFHEGSTDAEKEKKMVDLFPQSMDLFAWVTEQNRLLLFEYLKPDAMSIDELIHLYKRTPRFTAIRMSVVAAMYKNINTFDAEKVLEQLTDASASTYFLKHFLTLNNLNHTPFETPTSFSGFLQAAVEIMRQDFIMQKLIEMNHMQHYLPDEFSNFIKKPVLDRLIKLENAFQANLSTWEKNRNLVSYPLQRIFEENAPRVLVVDGLRADFYSMFADVLCRKVNAFPEEQRFCLSLRPSDTNTFHQFMDEHAFVYETAVERDYNVEKFKSKFLSLEGGGQAYIVSFLDEKIHSEKAGIVELYADFLNRLESTIFPVLSQLPANTIFYITSDHGFAERSGYSSKEAPRYVHGGDSMAERIVPFGAFRKG